jgi:hypothetical protein
MRMRARTAHNTATQHTEFVCAVAAPHADPHVRPPLGCHKRPKTWAVASLVGCRESRRAKMPVCLEGSRPLGSRVESKGPVDVGKNNAAGIDAHNPTRKLWLSKEPIRGGIIGTRVQPRTYPIFPSSHPAAKGPTCST